MWVMLECGALLVAPMLAGFLCGWWARGKQRDAERHVTFTAVPTPKDADQIERAFLRHFEHRLRPVPRVSRMRG